MVLTLDFSWSQFWDIIAHKELEEYNSLLTTQNKKGATKLLKPLNKYVLMVTSENG